MSEFRRKQKVLRVTGGHYNDRGIWEPGTTKELKVYASVQPLNANEASEYAKLLGEGISQFNAVKIYAGTPLRTAKQELPDGTHGEEADILLWQGKKWRVVYTESWQSGIISHYRMVAWEVEPDAGSDETVFAE